MGAVETPLLDTLTGDFDTEWSAGKEFGLMREGARRPKRKTQGGN